MATPDSDYFEAAMAAAEVGGFDAAADILDDLATTRPFFEGRMCAVCVALRSSFDLRQIYYRRRWIAVCCSCELLHVRRFSVREGTFYALDPMTFSDRSCADPYAAYDRLWPHHAHS